MKLLISLTFLVVIFVSGTIAQRGRFCLQRARPARCDGPPDVGLVCPAVPPRTMWYFNPATRTCIEMIHLGCGGNANRWCSRILCELKCVRRIG